MSFIGIVIVAGAITTCFVIGIVGGVLLVVAAVPLKRPPGAHRDGPPPRPRRRG